MKFTQIYGHSLSEPIKAFYPVADIINLHGTPPSLGVPKVSELMH